MSWVPRSIGIRSWGGLITRPIRFQEGKDLIRTAVGRDSSGPRCHFIFRLKPISINPFSIGYSPIPTRLNSPLLHALPACILWADNKVGSFRCRPYYREENAMGLLSWIIVGLIAGWLAGVVMRGGGYGVLGNIV